MSITTMEILSSNLFLSTISGLAIAMAAGFAGSFLVMRRMALVSDSLSHVALPGLGLGLLWHFSPFLGGLLCLLLAAFIIAGIEGRTSLPTDSIVGVLFASSIALGILITPEPELLEALFGDFTKITPTETWFTVLASLAIVVLLVLLSRRLILAIAAPDLGRTSLGSTRLAELTFLIIVAMVVALGIKFVGTLLMGTLAIIPAAAAKNVARSLYSFGIISMGFAAVSVLVGMAIVWRWGTNAGATIVLTSAVIFLLTLVFRRSS